MAPTKFLRAIDAPAPSRIVISGVPLLAVVRSIHIKSCGNLSSRNAGAVDVAGNSSFITGGDYTHTGGTTQVDGTLTATGGQVGSTGRTLYGLGTVVGDVTIAGVAIVGSQFTVGGKLHSRLHQRSR
jgi:hypothetical protein